MEKFFNECTGMRLAELELSAREALKPLLKALAYTVFALYLALGRSR